MEKLTESAIEYFAIKLFEQLDYSFVTLRISRPMSEHPERGQYGEMLLAGRLEQALKRINPKLSSEMLQDAFKDI